MGTETNLKAGLALNYADEEFCQVCGQNISQIKPVTKNDVH